MKYLMCVHRKGGRRYFPGSADVSSCSISFSRSLPLTLADFQHTRAKHSDVAIETRAYASLQQQGLAHARVGTHVANLDRSAADPPQASCVPYIHMAQNVAISTADDGALQRAMATLSQSGATINAVLQYQPEAGV